MKEVGKPRNASAKVSCGATMLTHVFKIVESLTSTDCEFSSRLRALSAERCRPGEKAYQSVTGRKYDDIQGHGFASLQLNAFFYNAVDAFPPKTNIWLVEALEVARVDNDSLTSNG